MILCGCGIPIRVSFWYPRSVKCGNCGTQECIPPRIRCALEVLKLPASQCTYLIHESAANLIKDYLEADGGVV